MIETSKQCPYCGAELDIGGQWYACGLWPLTCDERRTYTCLRNELKRLREQRDAADRLADLLAELLEAYADERYDRGARAVTQLEDDATLAIVAYREAARR